MTTPAAPAPTPAPTISPLVLFAGGILFIVILAFLFTRSEERSEPAGKPESERPAKRSKRPAKGTAEAKKRMADLRALRDAKKAKAAT